MRVIRVLFGIAALPFLLLMALVVVVVRLFMGPKDVIDEIRQGYREGRERGRRLMPVFILALWGWWAILAGSSAQRAQAVEGATVSTIAFGTAPVRSGSAGWTATAPLGTCQRCGRTVGTEYRGENFRIVVYDRALAAPVWSGCLDCMNEILRKNP